jgi:two-component system chemotaxis sensor kinase CheA
MDAVRSGIHALDGHFAIESAVGRGTRMSIRLPLTVAIVKVLLVETGGVTMAVPVSAVLRTLEVWRTIIGGEGRERSVPFEGSLLPVVDLHGLVGSAAGTPTIVSLVVTELDGRRVAVAVDRFVGQQEAYVKPLGRPLDKLSGLSGSTVLGDGRLVFVLDLPAIARQAGC